MEGRARYRLNMVRSVLCHTAHFLTAGSLHETRLVEHLTADVGNVWKPTRAGLKVHKDPGKNTAVLPQVNTQDVECNRWITLKNDSAPNSHNIFYSFPHSPKIIITKKQQYHVPRSSLAPLSGPNTNSTTAAPAQPSVRTRARSKISTTLLPRFCPKEMLIS